MRFTPYLYTVLALSLSLVACGTTTTTGANPVAAPPAPDPALATPSGAGGCADAVRVYTEEGFAGDSLELSPGRYDVDYFDPTPVPNDSIAAVCVPPGWQVTLYWDGGFAGDSKVLRESVPDLTDWSRSASSIEVIAPE
ncbi:MAG: hypothetical protein R3B06_04145 [Kofleriaceae bacterium]